MDFSDITTPQCAALKKHYIALDLELTQPTAKIIQVGVSVGNVSEGVKETRAWLIDPKEPLTEFIVSLTGITDEAIKAQAVPVAQVAAELGALIDSYPDMAVNPVTWSGGDMPELLALFAAQPVAFPYFGRRWLDVKTVWSYKRLAEGKSVKSGLASAMGSIGMPFKGVAHRADVDAENTLRFWLALLEREVSVQTAVRLLAGVKASKK